MNNKLISAIKDLLEVEWINIDAYCGWSDDYRCPWCENAKEDGHEPDCSRQKAVKLLEELE